LTSEVTEGGPVRVGVAGLGRAFVLMLATFRRDPRVRLVAASEPRAEARAAFEREFGGRTYVTVEEMCADPAVEMVYVATPHHLHAPHAIAAARAGKHVLVEKPLTVSIADGLATIDACRAAGVYLIVGPSHSFDAPVLQARRLIDSGAVGSVRMIQALNYTDFLYRPRRPEELNTDAGGGVVFSQGVHQIDIVRRIADRRALTVMAMTGVWDAMRRTEAAYAALVAFEGGAFASLTYSGFAHFDSDEWMDWIGELSNSKDPAVYGGARRALRSLRGPEEEIALKTARTYGTGEMAEAASLHEHFGPIVVVCDRADLRLSPDGIHVYGESERRFVPAPFLGVPRSAVIDGVVAAVRDGRPPAQTGRWGLASLEICHAIIQSARTGVPVSLRHQVESEQTSA
jgi:phthalate 4,5-cis-dihydrodiol dehydrogenase